jgi:hypothetical protein
MLFDLTVTQSKPPTEVRRQAKDLLAHVVAEQARLAHTDVALRREYLSCQLAAGSQNDLRMAKIDVARANGLIAHLSALADNPEPETETRLRSLLHLLDGPVQALEFSRERLSARVRPEQLGGTNMRILLLPEARRRQRVQVQDMQRVDPNTLRHATPRCYGDTGQAFVGWALNRVDVSSLILVVLAYLRMN